MGIFFRPISIPTMAASLPISPQPSLKPSLAEPSSLESAELSLETLNAEPTVSREAERSFTRSLQVAASQVPSGQFSWGRLFFAILLLFLIFGAGIWTALYNLEDWSKVLLHSFELVLGLVLGILGGEAAARH